MKRNLKFWTRFTWENMGVELSITAILAVMTVFGGEGLDLARFVVTVPYLLCIAAIFGMIMINSGTQSLYIPLLVSMGETRRNVLMGFHYFRALVIAVTLALCALIWLAVPGEVSSAGLRSLPDKYSRNIAAVQPDKALDTALILKNVDLGLGQHPLHRL